MLSYKFNILSALKERGYSTYRLKKEKIMGDAVIQKIRCGVMVSGETLDKLCELLDMQPGDMIEYTKADE